MIICYISLASCSSSLSQKHIYSTPIKQTSEGESPKAKTCVSVFFIARWVTGCPPTVATSHHKHLSSHAVSGVRNPREQFERMALAHGLSRAVKTLAEAASVPKARLGKVGGSLSKIAPSHGGWLEGSAPFHVLLECSDDMATGFQKEGAWGKWQYFPTGLQRHPASPLAQYATRQKQVVRSSLHSKGKQMPCAFWSRSASVNLRTHRLFCSSIELCLAHTHPSRKNLKAGHFLNEDTENACVSNSLKSAAVGRNPGPRLEEPRGQSESISQVSYILTSCSRPEALSFGTVDETGGSIVLRVSGVGSGGPSWAVHPQPPPATCQEHSVTSQKASPSSAKPLLVWITSG
ncbi:uncharacterized protein LOC124504119 [Lynx rufus]|uniref:uncharacterized protein LOC124504119 n=1 Tax=Lynx rufus TaxID=61384 RepID=UPI001F1254D4|nr:uncharacterized protein LOC124504119 [Lynx rufus]